MKRILLTLLALVVVIGMFSAVGYAGYRLGLSQSVETSADNDASRLHPFADLGPRGPRMHEFRFGREIRRGFAGLPGLGFGFFFLFRLLFWLAALVLLIWLITWLFTR